MQQKLPEFEGATVTRTEFHVSGQGEIRRAVRMNGFITVTARLKVNAVEHKTKDNVVTRSHKATVEELHEIDPDVFEQLAGEADGQPRLDLNGEH